MNTTDEQRRTRKGEQGNKNWVIACDRHAVIRGLPMCARCCVRMDLG